MRWTPDVAWNVTLCEAWDYLDAVLETAIDLALLQTMALFQPKELDKIRPGKALTLEEEFGEKIAAEAREVEERNRLWVLEQSKRHGRN